MPLTATIKSIQDIMRKDVGVDGDAQRVSQLTWMLFLKILDEKEDEFAITHPGYKSPLPGRLRWRSWAKDPEGMTGDELLDFVNNDLFRGLKGLKSSHDSSPIGVVIREVFADAYNYMKSGTLLRQVVNKMEEGIHIHSTTERHHLNDVYEQILKDLQSAGNAGEYYTPRAVTSLMVEMVNPGLKETVLDPACGTGGFLACTIDHKMKSAKTVADRKAVQESIHAIEKKPLPHMLCVTNMILHGIDAPTNIRHDNALAVPLTSYGPKDKVDVVLTNPPFGGMEEDGIETNFPKSHQTRETADLFMKLIITRLKDGGRAAVVLPDGFLFGEGVKTRLKQELLNDCNLHTIVRLPNGVFNPYTGIKTNLLFFTKGEKTKRVWYYEHRYPEGYVSYSKTRPLRLEEFAWLKKWWNKRTETEQTWKVSAGDIAANGYNLDIKNPNVVDESHKDPADLLYEYKKLNTEAGAVLEKLAGHLSKAFDQK